MFFVCSPEQFSDFGKQSEFVFQKGNILWQIEHTIFYSFLCWEFRNPAGDIERDNDSVKRYGIGNTWNLLTGRIFHFTAATSMQQILFPNPKTAPQKVVIPRKAFPDKNKESLCMVPLKSRCHAWYQLFSHTLRAQRPFVCIYEYIHKCVCPISNIAALETNFGMSAPGTCIALTDNPSQIVFPVFPGHKNHNCHKYLPLNKQRKQMTKKEAWWRGTSVRFSPLSTIRTTSLGQ